MIYYKHLNDVGHDIQHIIWHYMRYFTIHDMLNDILCCTIYYMMHNT